MIVHFLEAGRTLCGFGPPWFWPGIRWVAVDDDEFRSAVNCTACLAKRDCDHPASAHPPCACGTAPGVPVDHARVLVEAGVREAFRELGDRRADVSPLVDRVLARLVGPDDCEGAAD